MANSWLRLWHDMPNDPKWRTVARLSGQPIALVLAVYTHLLVDASRNVTRGHVTVTVEDLASALDVTDDQIQSVLDCMEGRVIDQGHLSGWENRQVKREENSDEDAGAKSPAQRKREQREREKAAAEDQAKSDAVTQCHAASRNVTLDKIRVDKEEEKESGAKSAPRPSRPKKAETTLAEYLKACKAEGVKAIPAEHAIRGYCADAGISDEMLQVAWLVFRDRHLTAEKTKRYRDWPGTFANSVKGRWYSLWFIAADGAVNWSSTGLQEKAVLDARMKAREVQHEPA